MKVGGNTVKASSPATNGSRLPDVASKSDLHPMTASGLPGTASTKLVRTKEPVKPQHVKTSPAPSMSKSAFHAASSASTSSAAKLPAGHLGPEELLIRFRQAAAMHGHSFEALLHAANPMSIPPRTPPGSIIPASSPRRDQPAVASDAGSLDDAEMRALEQQVQEEDLEAALAASMETAQKDGVIIADSAVPASADPPKLPQTTDEKVADRGSQEYDDANERFPAEEGMEGEEDEEEDIAHDQCLEDAEYGETAEQKTHTSNTSDIAHNEQTTDAAKSQDELSEPPVIVNVDRDEPETPFLVKPTVPPVVAAKTSVHASPAAEVEAAVTAAGVGQEQKLKLSEDDSADSAAKQAAAEQVEKDRKAERHKHYMCFLRAGTSSRRILPSNLQDMFENTSSRKEMFQMWLEKNKDMSAVSLAVTRRDISQKTGAHGKNAWSKRQMVLDGRYSEAGPLGLPLHGLIGTL